MTDKPKPMARNVNFQQASARILEDPELCAHFTDLAKFSGRSVNWIVACTLFAMVNDPPPLPEGG